ncbi:MAG TPA: efflux RND transporter periplasmic adaptor subunit [Pyrinomonadaceae bacterium]|nr:efflux RND transporter periplasmic adaptor subunit [Pyrinomonadaceae bacterium]
MRFTIKLKLVMGVLAMMFSLSAAAKAPSADDELECMLEPNTRIDISPAVSGVLSDVMVQRGDRVKRGQILAKLVSGPEQAAVELARARVEFGERKAVRNEDLFKKELISIHEKDEMDTEVLISKQQLKQAQEQLELRQIISPINGVVVERDKDPGEYVETSPLMTVVSLDPLNVEVVVPAERFGTIKKGMHGKVTTIGPKSGTYDAKVILIDQIIDAASGTIRVRLALANPNNAIPAGLKCYVKFKTK